MNLLKLLSKRDEHKRCSAVIVAAGSSQRMGTDKILMKLGPVPVLVRTILAFENCPKVEEIIIVARAEKIEEIAKLCHDNGLSKVSKVICGGSSRMESALAGVSAVKKNSELIAIHDGARPLVSQEVIMRTIEAAEKYMSAVPVIPSTDTLKLVDDNSQVEGTVDRSAVFRVQTPQVFCADLIKGALTKAVSLNLPITDDCSAMEMMGVKTYTVEGDPDNIKITTPNDIIAAEAVLRNRGELNANRSWV